MTKFLSISEITRRRSWTLVRTNFFVFFHFLRLASPAVRVTEGLWIYPSSLQAKTGRLQGVNPLPTYIKVTSKDKKICRRVHPSCTSLKFILLFESRHWYLIFDANPHKSKVSIPKRFPFYGNEQHCCNCSVTGILRTGMTLYCGVIHLNLRASSELDIFCFPSIFPTFHQSVTNSPSVLVRDISDDPPSPSSRLNVFGLGVLLKAIRVRSSTFHCWLSLLRVLVFNSSVKLS